jgi:hypothetical protein
MSMASKRRLRRNACGQKRRYASRKQALTALIRLIRAKPSIHVLACYQCRFCHGYHFGHNGGFVHQASSQSRRLAA